MDGSIPMAGSYSAIHYHDAFERALYSSNRIVLFDDSTNNDAASCHVLDLAQSCTFSLQLFQQ
jgi:hypothetical protein